MRQIYTKISLFYCIRMSFTLHCRFRTICNIRISIALNAVLSSRRTLNNLNQVTMSPPCHSPVVNNDFDFIKFPFLARAAVLLIINSPSFPITGALSEISSAFCLLSFLISACINIIIIVHSLC